MTSWSIVTLEIDADSSVYPKEHLSPTQFVMDSGVDEHGWLEDDIYYVLSFGRYQEKRFEEHMKDLHCPKYTGVQQAFVASVEDTGDTIDLDVYLPKQRRFEERKDGYETVDALEGSRRPPEARQSFQGRVEEEYGVEPVIEPVESTIPPDMVARI